MKTRTKIALWALAFFGPVWWLVPVGLRGSKATISEKTTCVTAPLTAEGLPDYAAWFNAKYGAGVTPENNAAAVLVDAWEEEIGADWSEEEKKDARERYAELRRGLGVGERPPGLPWMRSYFSEWAEKKGVATLQEEKLRQTKDVWVDFAALESEIASKPWTARQHPDVSQWLDEQQPFWEMLQKASGRPHLFMPVPAGKPIMETMCRYLSREKQLLSLCRTYAMRHAGEGRYMEALAELAAARRFVRLQAGSGHSVLDMLVAMSMDGLVREAVMDVAQALPKDHPAWAEVDRMAAEPFEDYQGLFSRNLGGDERAACLETLLRMQGGKVPISTYGMRMIQPSNGESVLRETAIQCDMDALLIRMNAHYDEAAARTPVSDREERKRKERATARMARALCVPPGWRARYLGETAADVLANIVLPVFRVVLRNIDRDRIAHAHLPVTLALAKYRLDHGRHPDKLEALVPAYLGKLPEAKHDFGFVTYRTVGDGKAFSIAYVRPDDLENGQPIAKASHRAMLNSPDFDALMEAEVEAEAKKNRE